MEPQNFSQKVQNFGSRKSLKDFLGNKKIVLYVGVGIILLLLIFSSFGMVRFGRVGGSRGGNAVSGNMPKECQKPEGQNLEQWKEHLSHHQNTLYCLDYYN